MAITKLIADSLGAGATPNQSAFKNLIINGDMSIAQRGTSVTGITGTAYNTIDRFQTNISSMGTWTQSQSTDVPTGQGFAKSLKMDCTTADASPAASDVVNVRTKFEGQNLQYLKKGTSSAQSLTLSFWVKSNKTGTYIAELYDTDNNRQISQSYTISSANTWENKTVTFAGDTTGTFTNDNAESLRCTFYLGAGSDWNSGTLSTSWQSYVLADRAVGQVNLADSTANEWYVTGVQLEAGTTASEFEFLPVDVNLQRCLRYYYKYNTQGSSNSVGTSHGLNTGEIFNTFYYPVKMRASPSVAISAVGDFSVNTGAANMTCGSSATERITATNVILKFGVVGSSGVGQGTCATLYGTANSRINLDGEL
tara:strand:+ start:31 stop:1131 length:1101 start_codon:yes stop_codon:yes gene_type:complete